MRTDRLSAWLVGVCLLLCLSGCMSWNATALPEPGRMLGDPEPMLEVADQLLLSADDRSQLLHTIQAYHAALARQPLNRHAHAQLAQLYILLGAGYTEALDAKRHWYQRAREHSELAMAASQPFREQLKEGARPWELAAELGTDDLPAMLFWATAVLYEFKEGMSLPEKLANLDWLERAGLFLERMEAIDPGWGGGAIPFSRAIVLYALPGFLGGDKPRAVRLLDEAVALGPNWLLNRWGRAKYYHVRTGNRQGFVEDLSWVLGQDINRAGGGIYPWKVYFQRDARQMLQDVDRYF